MKIIIYSSDDNQRRTIQDIIKNYITQQGLNPLPVITFSDPDFTVSYAQETRGAGLYILIAGEDAGRKMERRIIIGDPGAAVFVVRGVVDEDEVLKRIKQFIEKDD